MIFENTSYPIYGNKLYVEEGFDVWAPQIKGERFDLQMKYATFEASSEPLDFDRNIFNVIFEPSIANSVTISIPEFTTYRIGSSFFISPTIQKTIQILDATKIEEDGPRKQAPLLQITLHEDYDKVINRIGKLSTLNYNWDSFGAQQVKKDCIERGTKILLEVIEWMQELRLDIPAPFAVPTPEGRIQFEWKNLHKYLEIIIKQDSPDMEFFASDESPEGEYELEGVLRSLRETKEILYWLSSGAIGSLEMLFAKKAA